jgi:outer membrane immunogenic protein
MKLVAVIGGVALAFLSSLSARAADLPVGPAIKATPGYIPATFLWTGFYLGATAGDGWGTSNFYDPFGGGATSKLSLNGFLVGGYAGLNYQISSVVLGIEGDFIGSWSKGTTTDIIPDNLKTEVLWTASFTGRVGWAFDRLLIYGKGGVAFAFHRDTVTGTVGAPIGSATPAGWTVGGGLEYAFTEHWVARAEYDYFKFPNKALTISGGIPLLGGVTGNGQVGLNFNEARGGIAYKF